MDLKPISLLVEDMFPQFYEEDGPLFIQFVKAYYEWMEQNQNVQWQIQNLASNFDIDKAIDSFVTHFKQQYLPGLEFATDADTRLLVKHSREFLSTKGTEENIKLLMKLVYKQDASVFYPGEKVLKASDGTWFEPKYLELSPVAKNTTLVGQQIRGAYTGSTAVVERVVRKTIGGATVDVAYISDVVGSFQTGELVTADGLLDGCPMVIGSMTRVDLSDGGKDFAVGDILDINSSVVGTGGKARVVETGTATGRVTFNLVDGGYGYTNNTIAYVAEQMLGITNKIPDPQSNTYLDFTTLELVVQPKESLALINMAAAATVNAIVTGANTSGANVAYGRVVAVSPYVSGNQTITVLTSNGSFLGTGTSAVSNVIVSGVSGNNILNSGGSANVSATGLVVSTSSEYVGVANVSGTFVTSQFATIRGAFTNTVANVVSSSTGSSAGFEVGLLSDTEQVFMNTDMLAGKNTSNIAFMSIKVNGAGSNVAGLVGSVSVVNQTPNTSYLFIHGGGYGYSVGDKALAFVGGTPDVGATGYAQVANGVVRTITVGSGGGLGNGYSVGTPVVFSGTSKSITCTTNSGNSTVLVTSGNTVGFYVGLGLSGTNLAPGATVSGVASASTFYVTPAPISTGSATVNCIATGYVSAVSPTTNAIANVVISSAGLEYSSVPTVTVQTAGTSANLVAAIANGVVVSTTVTTVGSGYDSQANVSVTGSATVTANLQASMMYGYGFRKNPLGSLNTVLNKMLLNETYTIGSIASLTNINLGSGYNQDPSVLVIEPVVSAFNRRDLIVSIVPSAALYVVGETVQQLFSNSQPVITFNNLTNSVTGVKFEPGEVVVQGSASGTIDAVANGIIDYSTSTSGSFYVTNVTGTFQAGAIPIIGQSSNTYATVTNTAMSSVQKAARGQVKFANTSTVILARKSFNTSFAPNVPLVGQLSGVSASVLAIADDSSSLPIGLNAKITARAGTVSGFVSSVEVIDSGFAYKDYEPIELSKQGNPYVATGYVRNLQHGIGGGYFTSEKGFLNNTYNYIHDNDYWQEYSYEVRTGISLDRYSSLLKQISHVAGTRMFGNVERVGYMDSVTAVSGSVALGVVKLSLANGSSSNATSGFVSGESLVSNGVSIGYAGYPVYSECYASGYPDFVIGAPAYIPNVSTPVTVANTVSQSFVGLTSNTTFVQLNNVSGKLVPNNANTMDVFSNTLIVYTNTSNYAVNSVLYGVPSDFIASSTFVGNSYISAARNDSIQATYRTSAGYLAYASNTVARPHYDGANQLVGVWMEPSSTNLIKNSLLLGSGASVTSWNTSNSAVTPGDTFDLFGVQQAAKLTATDGSTGIHGLYQNVDVASGNVYTMSAFVRSAGSSHAALVLPTSASGTVIAVNLANGATSVLSGTASASSELFSGGWIRVSASSTSDASRTAANCFVCLANVVGGSVNTSFTGVSSTNQLHTFGVQFEKGTLSTFIPTPTAATATRSYDTFGITADGWNNLTVGSGIVTANTQSYIAVKPTFKIDYDFGANSYPLPATTNYVQFNGNTMVAFGTPINVTTTYMIVKPAAGLFSKRYERVYAANTFVLAYTAFGPNRWLIRDVQYLSDSLQLLQTDIVDPLYFMQDYVATPQVWTSASVVPITDVPFVYGDVVSQNTGITTVSGTVYTSNSSHVIVTGASGDFVASWANSSLVSGSSASVYVSGVDTISVPITKVTPLTQLANTYVIIQANNASSIANKIAPNSSERVNIISVPIANGINTMEVSSYTGKLQPNTIITGSLTNSSATVLSVKR